MLEKMTEAARTNANLTGIAILLFTGCAGALLLMRGRREAWPLLGLLALLLFNSVLSKNFFSIVERDGAYYGTPINLLSQGSEVMLLAIGLTLVIAVRGIDLSVGSVMALSGATCVILMKEAHCGPLLAALLSLARRRRRRSVQRRAGDDAEHPAHHRDLDQHGRCSRRRHAHHPRRARDAHRMRRLRSSATVTSVACRSPWCCVAAVFVVAALLCRRTALGLFMEAIGDNERASRLAGVDDRRIKLWLYGVSGLCAGIAGLVAASYISTADPDRVGRLRELDRHRRRGDRRYGASPAGASIWVAP